MFADFTTTFASVFGTTAQGKYLRGLYSDYTQITSVSALIGSAPNEYIEIKTKNKLLKITMNQLEHLEPTPHMILILMVFIHIGLL